MMSTRFRRLLATAVLFALTACGGGGSSDSGQPTAEQPFPTAGDTGAGGSESYLSSFRTAADRTQVRKTLAAKTFLLDESRIDSLVNYSYNDWGQGHDCGKGGYHGGHAGIDYQTKSVASTSTADEPIYSVSSGTFVGYRTHVWGITAIIRSKIRAADSTADKDYYFHYLHLRSEVTGLRAGDDIAAGQKIGVQGSLTPDRPNNAEHVHLEIALRELEFGRGAHPEMCTSATDATLDPYPVLAGLFASGTVANSAPALILSLSTGSSIQTGQAYTLTFTVADADSNLSYVDVNWNDGTAVERKAVSGGSTSVTFSRTFSTARTINWSARAYDTASAASPAQQGSFSINVGVAPGTPVVSPTSGSWTTSPQNIAVNSTGATTIYYRMVNTYDGSTPSTPATPTPSSNDGSLVGSSATFELFASTGQNKKTKLVFVGCNSSGCGSPSAAYSYSIDRR